MASDLPYLPPVSVLVTSDFTFTPQVSNGETAFNGIGEVELLTAGTLGESLSWFGTMALFENPGLYRIKRNSCRTPFRRL